MKIPSAFLVFYTIVSIFFLFPSMSILWTGKISNLYRDTAYDQYIDGTHSFIISILLSYFIFFISYFIFRRKQLLFVNINIYKHEEHTNNFLKKYKKIRRYLIPVTSVMILYFFYKVGFSKLLMLGSGVDPWKFRMIGFDDTPHIVVILNELARRVLLPFMMIIELTNITIYKSVSKKYLYIVMFLFIIGIISTLDRAPLMMFIVIFMYIYLVINPSFKKLIYGVFVSLLLLSLLASVMTYFQYNMLNFDIFTILESAQDFIMHRVLMVPTYAALELSYVRFPIEEPFLDFQYTRLGALFGATYVGTETAQSIYVAPVGYLADSWRNFGYFGVAVTSFILGTLSAFIDNKYKILSFHLSIVVGFLYLSFILFLIFGVFYSQGAFVQMIFIISLVFFFTHTFTYSKNLLRNRA